MYAFILGCHQRGSVWCFVFVWGTMPLCPRSSVGTKHGEAKQPTHGRAEIPETTQQLPDSHVAGCDLVADLYSPTRRPSNRLNPSQLDLCYTCRELGEFRPSG